ncbi:hypothetical protein VTJ04DRAFT_2714 [Mycothermus thermophilus]|uniref:uncharacterized protein n=1 Tax=Humicola insolens TaxID=85995 RepID=UPI0037420226
MPSTVVNTTLIMSSDLCQENVRTRYKKYPNMTEAQCRSRAGGALDREAFSQFSVEVNKDELKEQNPAWWKIMTDEQRDRDPFPHVMSLPVHLFDDGVTTNPYIHVWVKEGENHSMHHLGLGDNSNFLHSLVEPGLILPQWSLNVGSRSAEYPRSGALVLGGYDKNGIEGSFVTYSIKEPGVGLVQRPCPLQTKMTKVVVNISVNGTSRQVEPYDPTNVPGACIEPYDDFFRLGPKAIGDIVTAAGIELIDRENYSHLFNLEEGLVFPSKIDLNMTMEITLENGFTVTIPSHELIRPLTGLGREGNEDGKLITDPNYKQITIYRDSPLGDSVVLGRVFLSQVVLVVDLANREFKLAKQKQRPDFSMNLVTLGTCTPPSSSLPSKLSKVEIGLIVVGIALAIVTGLLAWLWFRVYKLQKAKAQHSTALTNRDDLSPIPPTPQTPP